MMSSIQERQLLLSEQMMKKLDAVMEKQAKLEEAYEKLRMENGDLKSQLASPAREKRGRRRRQKEVIPLGLPVSMVFI